MQYNKKSVEDIDLKGKTALCRCDFNVPTKGGKITSDKRIVAALPTIQYLIAQGAKVILCSHMGKPKGEWKPELSLAVVAERLSELLGKPVMLYANGIGPVHKPANRRRVKRVVERAALVTLRDHSSARELRDMGVTRDDIRVTPGSCGGGAVRPASVRHRHSKRQAVCGGFRPWLARYGRVPQGAGPAVRPPAPGPWSGDALFAHAAR